nr:unnamed protein product [Callosobruchus chinensis]
MKIKGVLTPSTKNVQKAPQEESAFGLELARQLVTYHMKRRLAMTNIPRELRTIIRRILGVPEQKDTSSENLLLERRKMCHLCPTDTVTSNEISILEVDQQIDCTFDRLSTCLGHQSVVDEAPDAESMLMEPDVNDPSFEPDPEDYDSSDSVDNVDDKEGNKSLLNNIPDILDDECPKRKRSTKYDIKERERRVLCRKKKENGKWKYNVLKEPRILREACNCKLSMNEKSVLICRETRENDRNIIFKQFWQYTWAEKKMFIKTHVLVESTSRKRRINDMSRRSYSNKSFLDKARLRVCKTMLMGQEFSRNPSPK